MRRAPELAGAPQRAQATAKVSAMARKWEMLSSTTPSGGKAPSSNRPQDHKGEAMPVAICAAAALILTMHVIRHRNRVGGNLGSAAERSTRTKPSGEMVRLVQPLPPVTCDNSKSDYDVGDI